MMNSAELLVLPNDKVRSALIDIIEKKFHLSNYKITIERGSSKGDNYIGIVYRAKVTWSNNALNSSNASNSLLNSKFKNDLSIIIKVPPDNETRREQFFARPCFLRESLVYDEIIPLFMNFQKSKGIKASENGFSEYSECYQTITDDKFEAIFLHDLKMDNFAMFNRFESIQYDNVQIVMKILGKFHAISLAIKDQCPEKFEKYEQLHDIFDERDNKNNLRLWMDGLKDRATNTLCKDNDQILIEKINRFYEGDTMFDKFMHLVKGEMAEPYAVLCHGDCWNNNILFKYENGKPVDARLIDWQVLRYASPVCDLMYYIFGCTTKELRDLHYTDFLDIYYQSITESIKNLGSDPVKIFPRTAFDEQLKKFGCFGFIMAIIVLPIFSTAADEIPDLDELSEQLKMGILDVEKNFNSTGSADIYNKAMRNVIVDMCNLGYI